MRNDFRGQGFNHRSAHSHADSICRRKQSRMTIAWPSFPFSSVLLSASARTEERPTGPVLRAARTSARTHLIPLGRNTQATSFDKFNCPAIAVVDMASQYFIDNYLAVVGPRLGVRSDTPVSRVASVAARILSRCGVSVRAPGGREETPAKAGLGNPSRARQTERQPGPAAHRKVCECLRFQCIPLPSHRFHRRGDAAKLCVQRLHQRRIAAPAPAYQPPLRRAREKPPRQRRGRRGEGSQGCCTIGCGHPLQCRRSGSREVDSGPATSAAAPQTRNRPAAWSSVRHPPCRPPPTDRRGQTALSSSATPSHRAAHSRGRCRTPALRWPDLPGSRRGIHRENVTLATPPIFSTASGFSSSSANAA